MKYYKSKSNEVFAYELDGSQDHLIGNKTAITEEEAQQLQEVNKQAALDKLSYAQKRAMEYPPITDYLDGIVKGDKAQVAAYIAACKLVKEKFPKPQE
jgi:hypothetical protein